MRFIFNIFAITLAGLLTLAAAGGQAPAQKRVALVIGNSGYLSTPELDNPRNDAVDIATALRRLGFTVIDGVNLDKVAFERKIREFAEALQGASVGVFYYAGHGLQVNGVNYLAPVDAKLATGSDLDFEMIRFDLVQRTMEREAPTNILFLDACRDNPLSRNLARAMGTRSAAVGHGLAPAEAGVGTLISFSTQPGAAASDGQGRNSPFTRALLKHIAGSRDDLSAILIDVRNDVMQETNNKQVPWEHSALRGRFYFQPSQGSPPAAAKAPAEMVATAPAAAVAAGPAPPAQARGLFTEQHASQVRALAQKHGFILPDYKIEMPADDVPAPLRRFVGIWIDDTGGPNRARKHLTIVTRVHKDGKVEGYFMSGPPTPTGFDKGPAAHHRVYGSISGDVMNLSRPNGTTKHTYTLIAGNQINWLYTNAKGQTATRLDKPVWTLVEAERSAKR